jgi:hypothetical protein
MKKLTLIICLLSLSVTAYPQWLGSTTPEGSIYRNGNVGIGAAATTANLHIGKQESPAGSSGEIVRLSLKPYGHNGGTWDFKSRDNSQFAFLDIMYGIAPALTLNSSGNVGIGTTLLSTANLHVGKQEGQPGSSGEILRLALQPYGHSGGTWNFKSRDNSQFAFLDIMYGTVQAMTINSSGSIGIGTGVNNPDAKLTVAGIFIRER